MMLMERCTGWNGMEGLFEVSLTRIPLQSENEADKEAWMSVLLNSKDGALTQAFAETGTTSAKGANGGYAELQRALVAYIRNLPSNDKCCDCGSNNGEETSNSVSS